MHLLDVIAQCKGPILVEGPGTGGPLRLPGPETIAPTLRICPLRYVLQDDVTELCTELAFEDDCVVGSSLELVRIPSGSLWLEFRSAARQKVLSEMGRLALDGCPEGQRIGMMVTAAQGGRRGRVDVCWDGLGGAGPELAPFAIVFDFDDSSLSASIAPGTVGIDVPAHLGLRPLFAHLHFELHPAWQRYYRDHTHGEDHYREVLMRSVEQLVEDAPFLTTFCLLLMSGSALRRLPAERGKLNKARARRGRLPLLDHVELAMNLTGAAVTAPASGADLRSSPRLHFVRGHLVRRGDAIFWRTSHMRGKPALGAIRSRTVSVRIAPSRSAAA